jgi:hypothetical protein
MLLNIWETVTRQRGYAKRFNQDGDKGHGPLVNVTLDESLEVRRWEIGQRSQMLVSACSRVVGGQSRLLEGLYVFNVVQFLLQILYLFADLLFLHFTVLLETPSLSARVVRGREYPATVFSNFRLQSLQLEFAATKFFRDLLFGERGYF